MDLVREPIPGRSQTGRKFAPASRQMAVRGVTSCEWPPCSKSRESVDLGLGAIRRSLALQHGCRSATYLWPEPGVVGLLRHFSGGHSRRNANRAKTSWNGHGASPGCVSRPEGAKRPFVRGPRKAVPARLLRPCSHERRFRDPGFVSEGSGKWPKRSCGGSSSTGSAQKVSRKDRNRH